VENPQSLAIVFGGGIAKQSHQRAFPDQEFIPNVKLARGWQFLLCREVAGIRSFKQLGNGKASATGKDRRSGAQRGALENNFGQRFS
jgi:hypothetical protein